MHYQLLLGMDLLNKGANFLRALGLQNHERIDQYSIWLIQDPELFSLNDPLELSNLKSVRELRGVEGLNALRTLITAQLTPIRELVKLVKKRGGVKIVSMNDAIVLTTFGGEYIGESLEDCILVAANPELVKD